MEGAGDSRPLLRLDDVRKSFDGVPALRGVSFDVRAGDCLALVGENGAGKSTLMKILSGVWPAGSFEGEVIFEGRPCLHASPLDARRVGISIIHQELCVFPELSVAENLFLSEAAPYDGTPSERVFQPVKWGELYRRAEALMASLCFVIPVRAVMSSLSVAERQLVEIARAFHQKARLLVLDEPTSALSTTEVERLFEVIRRARGQTTFIYISHKLDEVFALCNRIVVLRDGAAVKELDPKSTDADEVIRHMVGRPVRALSGEPRAVSGSPVLKVDGLRHTGEAGQVVLEGISFELRAGEVLGVSGLMGSGRSELLRSLLGVLPGDRAGVVEYDGKAVAWRGVKDALDDGVAFVPEDRKKDGVFLDQSIQFNATISVLDRLLGTTGLIDLEHEKRLSADINRRMRVKYKSPSDPIRILSGGNQQKVLLAKVMAAEPRVLFLDEPTRGIDVGAKEEIYDILRGLASEGIAVLLVSSELPEVLALSDRVLVLREGRAVGTLENRGLTQERVMQFAAGGSNAG